MTHADLWGATLRPPCPRTYHAPYLPHELDARPDAGRIRATLDAALDGAEAEATRREEAAQAETAAVQDHLDCALFALEDIADFIKARLAATPISKAELLLCLKAIGDKAATAIG